MTWILLTKVTPIVGDGAKPLMIAFDKLDAKMATLALNANPLTAAQNLIPALEGGQAELLEKVLSFTDTELPSWATTLKSLVRPLNMVAREDVTTRMIGWPGGSFNKDKKILDVDAAAISLSLTGSGLFVYSIDKAVEGQAISATLTIKGELGAGFTADFIAPRAKGGIDLDLGFSEEAVWKFKPKPETQLTGRAVSSALVTAGFRPDSLKEMREAFADPYNLESLTLKRRLQAGVDANARIAIPIKVGETNFSLEASANSARETEITITSPDNTRVSIDEVNVAINVSRNRTKTLGFGAGFSIGLSSFNLAPIKKVAEKIRGASEYLDVEELASLLKPGTLARNRVLEIVKDELAGSPDLLGDLIALLEQNEGEAKNTLSSLVSNAIDDSLNLDGRSAPLTMIVDQVKSNLADQISTSLAAKITKIVDNSIGAAEEAVNQVANGALPAVTSSEPLKQALDKLTEGKIDTVEVAHIVEAADALRTTLRDIAGKVDKAVNSNLALTLAYRRRKLNGLEAKGALEFSGDSDTIAEDYERLLRKPISTLDQWLPNYLPGGGYRPLSEPIGVTIDHDTRLVQTYETETTVTGAVTFGDITIAGQNSVLLRNLKVSRSPQGVLLGSKSSVRKSRRLLNREKVIEWRGLMGAAMGDDVNPVGEEDMVAITVQHTEKTLKAHEVDDVFERLVGLGVVSNEELTALKAELEREQMAAGSYRGSVILKLGWSKTDMLAMADYIESNLEDARETIAISYIEALKVARPQFSKKKDFYPKRRDVAATLRLKRGYSDEELAKKISEKPPRHIRKELSRLKEPNRNSISFIGGTEGARAAVYNIFFFPRYLTEALVAVGKVHRDLEMNELTSPRAINSELASINKKVEKLLEIDISSDMLGPWVSGFLDAMAELADDAGIKPAMVLEYDPQSES